MMVITSFKWFNTHIFMDGKTTEQAIVAKIILMQAIVCIAAFAIFL